MLPVLGENKIGGCDHKHVCIDSETWNTEPALPALGHSLTMTRPPSTYSSPSAYLYCCQWLEETDSLDLITDLWRSLWTSDKMQQT